MWGILVILGVILFLVWASADIRSRVYLPSRCKADTRERQLSLTFDDGPDPVRTPLVLDVLKAYGVKATFFLIGEKAEAYPEIVLRIHREGHLIGNHTYSHAPAYPLWPVWRISDNIQQANEVIFRITGLRPLWFRPPFGVTNPSIAQAVRGRWVSIGWNIRSYDTAGRISRPKVCQRIAKRLQQGSIILLHDRCLQSDSLLVQVLEEIQKQKLEVVPLDKLLDINAYEKI